jgi:hypothetical protein
VVTTKRISLERFVPGGQRDVNVGAPPPGEAGSGQPPIAA